MEPVDPRLTVALLLVVGTFLLALAVAWHDRADELTRFIRDMGEWGRLAKWRMEEERKARIKRGHCPNDDYPAYGGTCVKCGWKR